MNNLPENIDPNLVKAYKNTTYSVFRPSIDLRIGELHPHFDEFLIDNNVYTWAFITAFNPFSQKMTITENEERHDSLLQLIKERHWRYCEGEGIGDDKNWAPEKSVLILGISLDEAFKMAKTLEQFAFVFGQFNQKAQLIGCTQDASFVF